MSNVCKICDICCSSSALLSEHLQGKKHIKAIEEKERLENISKRSIFLPNFQNKIEKEDVELVLKEYGEIERVILDKNNSNYAIVEFRTADEAQRLLHSIKTLKIGNNIVKIKERKVDFEKNFQTKEISRNEIEKCLQKCATLDFTNKIEALIYEFSLNEEEIKLRVNFTVNLSTYLQKFFASTIKINLFGSSVTGTGFYDSDLDMNFVIKDENEICLKNEKNDAFHKFIELDVRTLLNNKMNKSIFQQLTKQEKTQLLTKLINEYRKENGIITNIIPVLNTRCPVVRFFLKSTQFSKRIKTLSCELSIENSLSEKKANLIKDVMDFNQTNVLRKFFFIIKLWALSNNLFQTNNDSQQNSTWKSYILSLLIISYLQQKGFIDGPLIKENSILLSGWKIEYSLFFKNIDNFDIKNNLKTFFVFLYNSIKPSNIFCISMKRIINVEEFKKLFFENNVNSKKIEEFKFSIINVQDPFELSHNVASNVSMKALSKLRKVLMYSIFLLKNDLNDIDGLLSISNLETQLSEITVKNHERNIEQKKLKNTLTIKLENNLLTSIEVFESFMYLFTEILLLDKINELKIKKSRQIGENDNNNVDDIQCEKCEFNFCITYPIWNSRRALRRMYLNKHKNLSMLAIEQMVSEELKKNYLKNNNFGFSFCVQIYFNELESPKSYSEDISEKIFNELYIVFTMLDNIKDSENFQNLIHFTSTFVPKFLPQVLKQKKDGVILFDDSNNSQNNVFLGKRKY